MEIPFYTPFKFYVARNFDGNILLFYNTKEPERKGEQFVCENIEYENDAIVLDDDLFPEVTWENSPKEVKMILK